MYLYLLALLFTSSGPIGSSRSPSVLIAALACPRPCAWPCGRARCAVHLLAYVLAALACPRPCVRLLMPGQRWTFLSAVPVWPALLARFPCACGRARARVCVGAVRLPSSRLPCILFAYNVHSPPLCKACPPRFRPPQTFSRSFAGGRYLSRCRRCGWMTRLDVAIRGDLGAL